MADPDTAKPANDNPVDGVEFTISFMDLAKGLGRDEDDLLMQLAEIFAARDSDSD